MLENLPNTETAYPVIYTTKDLQNIFKCGINQAYEIMHINGFPSIQINGKYIVEKLALEKWLEKNRGRHVLFS